MSYNNRLLIVSSCQMRGNTAGLLGTFLSSFGDIQKEGCKIELYNIGFFNKKNNPSLYDVDKYWVYPSCKVESFVRKIPLVRSVYAQEVIVRYFDWILQKRNFDLIIVFQVQSYSDRLIKLAHKRGVKVMLVPWGSDILRASKRERRHLMKAFSDTDFVLGNERSNAIIASKNVYNVSENKIRLQKIYLKGVQEIIKIRGKKNRDEMASELGFPSSNYIIVCGYNAAKEQRHEAIIDAILKNKEFLPEDYLLVFPVSYSGNKNYIIELQERCMANNLNSHFITSFISDEQMAYLHLVTDLFIQIQPTDCGSAFMIEALYAQNRIVTGKWLSYVQFEQFGIPYHLIERVEDLDVVLKNIFLDKEERISIPQELLDMYTIPEKYRPSDFWESILKEM